MSFKKVTRMEYLQLWATFVAIVGLGLGKGLLLGIVIALLHFAISYARVNIKAYSVLPSRGCYVRPFAQRSILEVFSGGGHAQGSCCWHSMRVHQVQWGACQE